MSSGFTRVRHDYLLALARSDGAPGSREARAELVKHGLTWTTKKSNVRANAAMAALHPDRLPAMFREPTTHINNKPTPNAARAIAAAKNKKRTP